jgi:predicted house-cleaning noncanonical NTP pyrophosphatase (MazG superfamily)
MRIAHNKLVRDRIPDFIESEGHQPVMRVLDDDEYRIALLAKLVEEAQQARAASAGDLPSELADIMEVLRALVKAEGLVWEDILAVATRKRAESGGFEDRIFLEYTDQYRREPWAAVSG